MRAIATNQRLWSHHAHYVPFTQTSISAELVFVTTNQLPNQNLWTLREDSDTFPDERIRAKMKIHGKVLRDIRTKETVSVRKLIPETWDCPQQLSQRPAAPVGSVQNGKSRDCY